MLIWAILATLAALGIAYGGYTYRKRARKLEAAVRQHHSRKTAPAGYAGVNTDSVDVMLWEETGIKEPDGGPRAA